MPTKQFYVRFGTGNPATTSGLAPTFIVFRTPSGVTTPPAISEMATTGIYTFAYECFGTVSFVIDGATTGLQNADRFVFGAIDVSTRLDEFTGRAGDAVGASTLYGQVLSTGAVGSTLTARVGTIADSVGFSTVFGQLGTATSQGATALNRIGEITDVAGFSTIFGQAKQNTVVADRLGTIDDVVGFSTVFGQVKIASGNAATLAVQIGTIDDPVGFSTIFGQVKSGSISGQTMIGLMGLPTDPIGDSAVDPNTLFGFIRRTVAVYEGQSTYDKGSGQLTLLDKTGATTLVTRTIQDTGTQITKT